MREKMYYKYYNTKGMSRAFNALDCGMGRAAGGRGASGGAGQHGRDWGRNVDDGEKAAVQSGSRRGVFAGDVDAGLVKRVSMEG